jgi:hypothetical protein
MPRTQCWYLVSCSRQIYAWANSAAILSKTRYRASKVLSSRSAREKRRVRVKPRAACQRCNMAGITCIRRELYQRLDSQQLSQSPRSPQSLIAGHKRRRTRPSSPERTAGTFTTTDSSASNTDDTVTARPEPESESPEYLTLQRHFSANIRRAWKKFDKYYNKSDVTPIHRAAVLLHPRLKWRWFEKYWKHKPS